jgi:hypothetical protein
VRDDVVVGKAGERWQRAPIRVRRVSGDEGPGHTTSDQWRVAVLIEQLAQHALMS